ncbi:DUF47 family protein [Streptomyces sp. NPDC019396]|uniref:DUF47 domain-containing protein n=1 Tax=Streptomyces sp. NPDC019396 TaxID=3154687 RepID=UPI0033C67DB5
MRLRLRIRRLFHDLSGRTDRELVSLVRNQLDAAREGAVLALATVRGQEKTNEARRKMGCIEHAGDAHRGALVDLLQRVIAAPMDREDLNRLSRSVDDVLDGLRDLVRELDLLAVPSDPLLEAPLEALVRGIVALDEAVGRLLTKPADVAIGALAVRKADIRQQYQLALAQLLNGDITVQTLRRQALLRRADVVGLRLAEAANALSDGAMKRCH